MRLLVLLSPRHLITPSATQCCYQSFGKTQSLCRNPKLQVGSGPAEVPARTPDPAERSATTRFGLHFATEGRNPFWTLLQAMDLLPSTHNVCTELTMPKSRTLDPATLYPGPDPSEFNLGRVGFCSSYPPDLRNLQKPKTELAILI